MPVAVLGSRDAFWPALGPMRHGSCCLRGNTWIRNSPMAGLTEVLGCAVYYVSCDRTSCAGRLPLSAAITPSPLSQKLS